MIGSNAAYKRIKMKKRIVYALSIVLAVVFLILGYLAVRDGYDIQYGENSEYLRAKITEITMQDTSQIFENCLPFFGRRLL